MSSWTRLAVLIVSVASFTGLHAGDALYQFDGNLTSETGHADLVPVDQAPGGGPSVTFGTAMIDDEEADVATLGGNTTLHLNPDAAPNGGGNYVNDYTIVVDMAIPSRGDDCSGSWVSFYNTNATNTNDGDMFVNTSGGLGISSDYDGCVDGEWHRIAMCVSANPPLMQCYVDGYLANEINLDGVDGRWSLYSNAGKGFQGLYLFGDDSGDVPGEIMVNSALFVDRCLSSGEIECLGEPTAAGISTAVIPNDTCDDAIDLELDVAVGGTTAGAVPDDDGSCDSNDSPAVWYRYTASGGFVTASLCGSSFDTFLSVFTGECGALECLDYNDDSDECDLESMLSFDSTEGTTYYIRVFGYDAEECGPFTVSINGPPANDDCAGAIDVEHGVTAEGTTSGAGADDDGLCDSNDSPAVWYRYTAPGGPVNAALCGTYFDTYLSVFTGECGALECLDYNDDECNYQSIVSFDSTEGATYYIRVFGYDDDEFGRFFLHVGSDIENDECADAIDVRAGVPTEGTTGGADADGEGSCDANDSSAVWYRYTAFGGPVTASLCGGSVFDTYLSVFTGECGTLECLDSNDDGDECDLESELTFESPASNVGTTYYIRVFGYDDEESGPFTLTVTGGENFVYGETSNIGDGTITSYALLDGDGNVEAYGFKMGGAALDGLSGGAKPEPRGVADSDPHTHVHMPEGFDSIPVEYVDIHFLPGGHPGGPGNNYWLVPHFDFHFFLNGTETAATYTDADVAFNPMPDAFVPAGYILAPDSFVPGEGVHWVNPAEFAGPYTTNFIYGSYDGEMTFIEPMEALSFMEDMRDGNVGNFSGPIGAAAYSQKPGLYPSSYSVSYDEDEDTFRVEMNSLSMTSAPPYQVPGDCNLDGRVDLADAVCLVGFLFRGSPELLPCDDGGVTDAANLQMFDWNASGELDLSDVVSLLGWRWLHGPPHALGTDCVLIPGCPEACSP